MTDTDFTPPLRAGDRQASALGQNPSVIPELPKLFFFVSPFSLRRFPFPVFSFPPFFFVSPVLLMQSYCKNLKLPNVFAIIFAILAKIDKIYHPGRKTKSCGAEKLVFRLEKLSFLNCNCNCHHHGRRGICVSHIWAQAMTITITVQNSAPYFLRKRRKRNLLYIYIFIYI